MNSPIKIYGGKHYMLKFLLPLIPPHKTYIEVFGGGANLLLAKPISPIEVYNDIDSNLVNFYRVLRDQPQELINKLSLTPCSREEFYTVRNDLTGDPVERAWKFFIVSRMAFAGRHHSPSFGRCITKSRRGMAMSVSSWLSSIDGLEEVHNRLLTVLIEHQDFRKLIPSCDEKDVFFYLDPPYVTKERKGKDKYKHEMSDKDHEELIDIVLNCNGKFLISGYNNEIYSRLGWERIDYETISYAAARTKETGLNVSGIVSETQKRIECIWKNY